MPPPPPAIDVLKIINKTVIISTEFMKCTLYNVQYNKQTYTTVQKTHLVDKILNSFTMNKIFQTTFIDVDFSDF